MRVLITGIAGFLGSHLADALIAAGHTVSGIDDLSGGAMRNVPGKAGMTKADCCNHDLMHSVFDIMRPEIVYHLACHPHEGLSVFSPALVAGSVFQGSVAVFSAAAQHKVKRVIFASSMARYGEQWGAPYDEDMTPAPLDPYGVAKLAAEDTLRILARAHSFEHVIAVPHNIIGVRQKYTDPYRNVASIMLNRILSGKEVIIYGDGNQVRRFSPIEDCISSLVRMLDWNVDGEIINIGPDGDGIAINELARLCHAAAHLAWRKPTYYPARPLEMKIATCSSNKARLMLSFSPKGNLEKCLRDMANSIIASPFDYSLPLEIINDKTPETWRERKI